jgi:hypothetical protein
MQSLQAPQKQLRSTIFQQISMHHSVARLRQFQIQAIHDCTPAANLPHDCRKPVIVFYQIVKEHQIVIIRSVQ